VFLSENEIFEETASMLVWHQKNLYYDWKPTNEREVAINLTIPQSLLNNGTMFAHVFLTKSNFPYNPNDINYEKTAVIYGIQDMTKYLSEKNVFKKNLLSEETNSNLPETTETTKMVSYWKPNLTIHLVEDTNKYARGSVPPQIENYMTFDDSGAFFPVLFLNEFWLLKEHLIPINNTVKTLPLYISYNTISLMKWQIFLQIEQSFSIQRSMGTAMDGESDELKRMITETNPYLLGMTFIVTILHSIFDFLAFKNDIVFWKNKKNFEGMSIKTIFINTFCQLIIFLYLLDSDTSWVILISCGIGLLIEAWKIKKAVIVGLDWSLWIPITFKDRETYASKTKEFDDIAMKYLSYVLYPLVVGYAIYSLVYETHKSWYSWILSTLTGCVYTFGFIMMCPQLFINYKLKSVAHLPWRTFTYKALNTFIDDLFAFIIKMPTMHRLSCFRDDIVFLIYLYQRWAYRVDHTRVNEFGQGGDTTNKED